MNDDFGENDSSFTSVSQQASHAQEAVKKPMSQALIGGKENVLDETIVDEKHDLKSLEASDSLGKIQAEQEALLRGLTTKRNNITMKQFDGATKDFLKAAKRSKDVFETLYDDFTAIAAAADNFESSSNEFNAFLNEAGEFFNLQHNTSM